MPVSTDTRARRPGFTLIELLVVIAIIAVLIALLLARGPGGARGRPAVAVHQQPEADRPGPAQLREHEQLLPPGRPVVQLRPTSPPQNQYVDGAYSRLPAAPDQHRRGDAVQRH